VGKLKLKIEDLRVDSFGTIDPRGGEGTVLAFVSGIGCTRQCDTVNATCDGEATCGGEYTCNLANPSCAPSCTACDTYKCGPEGTGYPNECSLGWPCDSGVVTGGCTC
jgi:hypothetical protein